MEQKYVWYRFSEGKPEEYKIVLVRDKRYASNVNPLGVALGYCTGYEMQVMIPREGYKPEVLQNDRPEFWSTLGNDDPNEIVEKPQYNDVSKKIYPDYYAEYKFRGRGGKRKIEEPEEIFEEEELEDDIDDDLF